MMGADPVRGLVSADNALLYVGNLHSQEVTVYSIDDGKRIGSIHVGDGPSALAFSATGHLLFVVDARSGDVAVVRTVVALVVHPAPHWPRSKRHRRTRRSSCRNRSHPHRIFASEFSGSICR